jgi:hypothetical protein
VAIARQLALEGRSPLFLQPPDLRQGADRRLAYTLDAAQRALEVSGDFDRPEDLATAALGRKIATRRRTEVMDWQSKDVGTKDVIIGFGALGAAALVAVILAIIFSLT